jgi:hypothetical protein
MKTITFTRVKLQALKQAYNTAKRLDSLDFTFEGQQMLVAYAKYLIEYLEMNFKPDAREVKQPTESQKWCK